MAALTQFISSAMGTFWPVMLYVFVVVVLSPQTVTINKTTMGG